MVQGDLRQVFSMQFIMFAEMAVGYCLVRFGVLKPHDRAVLSRLVITVFLPATIINSFNTEFSMSMLKSFIQIFCTATGTIILSIILNRFIWKNAPREHQPVLQYATVCSNCGFLGNAVADSIYGADGLMYSQIYLFPIRVFMWSIGLSYFARSHGEKGSIKKVLTHPCIIAVTIGLVRMLLRIPFPEALNGVLSGLGRCSTPSVMIFLGMTLGECGFRNLISKLTLKYSLIRLIVIPVLVLIPCVLLKLEPIVTGLTVFMAAMPAGSNTAVLAEQYDVDVEFAANCVVLTTILSIALLPAWIWLINMLV